MLDVAPGDEAALTGQLRVDERCDEGLERGAVQVASVDAGYPTGAVVDPAGLDFADRRSLVAPAGYAERHVTAVVLRTRLTALARLVELLDLAGVRVERAA
ncbi:hypothetical protein [Amycolatopsis sp. MtRt-6]|uniref:hypothetical protein n=1 Tax=Amycolatopsis sp. MtRt-6 TaxID=2792782 RepID=UPI001A90B842|nr:hypothetical protein [Amycolatopsis sp. MtRt-6]